MAEEGKIGIELLLQPLLKLDENYTSSQIKAISNELNKALSKASDDTKVIGLRISPKQFKRALNGILTDFEAASKDIERVNKQASKTTQERLEKQLKLNEAYRKQVASARKASLLITRAVQLGTEGAGDALAKVSDHLAKLQVEFKKTGAQGSAAFKELQAAAKLPGLAKKLKGLTVPAQVFKKTAEDKTLDKRIAKRREALIEFRKTSEAAGAVGFATKAKEDLAKLKAFEDSLARIRKVQAASAELRVPFAGFTEEQLKQANERKRLIGETLKSGRKLHISTIGWLKKEQAAIDASLAKHRERSELYREEGAAVRRAVKITEQVFAQRRALEEMGRPERLEIGSAEERRYANQLRKLSGALGAAQGEAVQERLSKENLQIFKDLNKEVDSLVDAHNRRRQAAEVASRSVKKQHGREAKDLEKLLQLNEDLRRRQKLVSGVDPTKLKSGSEAARLYLKNLREVQSTARSLSERLEKTDAKAAANLRRQADRASQLIDRYSKLGQQEKARLDLAQRLQTIRKARPEEWFSAVLVSLELDRLRKYGDEVRSLKTSLEALRKSSLVKVGSRTDKLLRQQVDLARQQGDAVKQQIKNLQTVADKSSKVESERERHAKRRIKALEEITVLERRLASFQKGDTGARIAGADDLESLKASRRELNSQAAALAGINTRMRDYGIGTVADLKKVEKQQKAVSAGLQDINDRVYKLTGGFAGLNQTVRQFFRYALFYGGMYQVIGVFTQLSRATIQLQADFKNIQAVTAATEEEMVKVSAAVREVALTTRFSASEIAKAATTIGQAGVEPEQLQSVLQSTADFAAAVGGSIEIAADLITTFRDVYKELDDREIADKLTKAINISKLTSADLKTIVSISGQTASDIGLSAEQYLAAVGTLRNAGIKASTVTTGLRQLLTDIFFANDQTLKKLQQRYSELGESFTQQEIKQRFFSFTQAANPLLAALQELQRLGATGPAKGLFGRVFEVRSTNVMRALINNMDELVEKGEELQFGGAAAEAAAIQMEALQAQLTNVGAAFTFFSEELFRGGIEGLTSFSKSIVEVLGYLTDLDLKLKSTGDTGLLADFGVGAAAGLVAGSATPGGMLKKLAAGIGAGVGVTGAGIAGREDEFGAESLAFLALTAVSILSAFRGALAGAAKAIGKVTGFLGTAVKTLNKLPPVLRFFGKGGWVGAVITALIGITSFFTKEAEGSEYAESLSERLESLKEQEAAARKRLERDYGELEKAFSGAYADYGKSGTARRNVDRLIGQVTGFEEGLQRFLDDVGSDAGVEELRRVIEKYAPRHQARVKTSATQAALLEEVAVVTGKSTEQLDKENDALVGLLNGHSDLQKALISAEKNVTELIRDLRLSAPSDLRERGLEKMAETYKDLGEEVRDLFESGYSDDPKAFLNAVKDFYDTAFEAGEAEFKSQVRDLVEGGGEADRGTAVRAKAIERILTLYRNKEPELAKEALENLFQEERKHFGTLKETADAIRVQLAEATSELPEELPTIRKGPTGAYGQSGKIPQDARSLFKIIERAEGTTDLLAREKGFASGYDVPFGYGKYAQPSKPLTSLTIAEVKRFQAQRLIPATKGVPGTGGRGTGAVGKFQFTQTTLSELVRQLGLSESTIFSPEIQDRLAERLLKNIGLDRYRSGKISSLDFGESLSGTWAGIVNPKTGRGSYPGQPAREHVLQTQLDGIVADVEEAERKASDELVDTLKQRQVSIQSEVELGKLTPYLRRKITDLLLASEEELKDFIDFSGSAPRLSESVQSTLDAYDAHVTQAAQDAAQAARKRRQSQDVADSLDLSIVKDELKRAEERGETEEAYIRLRKRQTALELEEVERREAQLRAAEKPAQGGSQIDIDIELQKLAVERVAIQRKENEDLRKYSAKREEEESKISAGRQSLAAEQAKANAVLAVNRGRFEEADKYLQEYVAATKAELAEKRKLLGLEKNESTRRYELERLNTESSGVVKEILDLLKRRRQKLEDDLYTEINYGVRSQQEVEGIVSREERGIEPSRSERLERQKVALEAIKLLEQDTLLARETISQLDKDIVSTKEDELLVSDALLEYDRQRTSEAETRARAQGKVSKLSGGFGGQLGALAANANKEFENLSETIGTQLVTAVGEFTAGLGEAAVKGEDLGDTFKQFFSSFFLQIGKMILQLLVVKALTSALGSFGGAEKGGVAPAVGKARGGVIRKAEGGMISGNPGVDTTPGAIVHPDGSASPLLVTHGEAILPAKMVQKLGEAKVQSAIDRFNRTGAAHFATGGLVSSSGQNGSQSYSGDMSREQEPVQVKIVNVPGNSVVSSYLQSYEGEKVVLNVLEKNRSRLRSVLGG